jgi:hypothetical protein
MVRKFLLNGTKVRFIDDYKQKKRLNAELSQRQYAEDNKIHHTQLYIGYSKKIKGSWECIKETTIKENRN